jgi:hypothetical protein
MAEHNVLYVFFAGSTLNWLIMEVFRPGNYWGKLPEVSDDDLEISIGVCLRDDLRQSRFKIAMLWSGLGGIFGYREN